MSKSIILGNIITMDEKRPFAKAALVKNGGNKKLIDFVNTHIINIVYN